MKINGQKINSACEDVVILPRPGSTDLVFKVIAVLDFEEFEKLCPTPVAPTIFRKGETVGFQDVTDKDYIESLRRNNRWRFDYMIYKSILATEGLEFETVFPNKPETWENIEKEMKASGITPAEFNRIVTAALGVNGLNDKLIEEARARFFSTQKEKGGA